MPVTFMTDDLQLTADNSNAPLWKQAALRVAQDETRLPALSTAEQAALFAHAQQVMKPSAEAKAAMAVDPAQQAAYILAFVRAYKAGLPPFSGITEAMRIIPA